MTTGHLVVLVAESGSSMESKGGEWCDDDCDLALIRSGLQGLGGSGAYVPSGDDIWKRQGDMREKRKEQAWLAEEQRIQYERLLEETKVDRQLCQVAFEAGFIEHRIEYTLMQAETAESIRLQAERVGIPWRGLAVSELMEVLKETATEKRDLLLKLLSRTLSLEEKAKLLVSVASRRIQLLDDARDDAIAQVRGLIEKVVLSLRERERALVETTKHVADDRKKNLKAGLQRALGDINKAKDLLVEGSHVKQLDDLRLLIALHEHGPRLEDTLKGLLGSLQEVEVGQKKDSEQGLAGGASAGLDEGKTKDEESDSTEADFQAPKIPFNYDPFIMARISLFGSIGTLDAVKEETMESAMLQWDAHRSDVDTLGISVDGCTVAHRGPKDKRATAFGKNGFAKGTVVMRVSLAGVKPGQWVSVGIASAAQVNMPRMIKDSVILESTSDDPSPSTMGSEATVTIVMDCENRIVEYYKAGQQIKLSVLERPSYSVEEKDPLSSAKMMHFFPYCTLFHPGQIASIVR